MAYGSGRVGFQDEIARRKRAGTWSSSKMRTGGDRDSGKDFDPDYSQKLYEKEVLPGQAQAVEEQIGAMSRAVGTEEAAASARARDISRTLQGSTPGGFEDVLRGSITQEAGEALGYESALRGAKAQKEVQDPSRLAPIYAAEQESIMDMEERVAEQQAVGQAISTISSTAGGILIAGAQIAATAAAAATTTATVGGGVMTLAPASGPAAPVVAAIGAIIVVTGMIVGAIASGTAGRGRRNERRKQKYDPSKVKEVSFATALGSAQRGPRGYVGSQFTGGSALGAGIGSRIQNLGGMAPSAGVEPWMQFAGV